MKMVDNIDLAEATAIRERNQIVVKVNEVIDVINTLDSDVSEAQKAATEARSAAEKAAQSAEDASTAVSAAAVGLSGTAGADDYALNLRLMNGTEVPVRIGPVTDVGAGVITPAQMSEIAEEIDKHALESDTVSLSKAQTVSGKKTFKDIIVPDVPSGDWVTGNLRPATVSAVLEKLDQKQPKGDYALSTDLAQKADRDEMTRLLDDKQPKGNYAEQITVTELENKVNGKADKNATVDLTGDQTIDGNKEFLKSPYTNVYRGSFFTKVKAVEMGVTGNKYDHGSFIVKDRTNSDIIWMRGNLFTDLSTQLALTAANKNTDGTPVYASIIIRCPRDGTPYATAPPTAPSAKGSEIATAGWVRSLLASAGINVNAQRMSAAYAPVQAEGMRMMAAESPETATSPEISAEPAVLRVADGPAQAGPAVMSISPEQTAKERRIAELEAELAELKR